MELFQELLFTISFSLIVSLLIAKIFSMASNYDDLDTSKTSRSVEEKIEKGWVVSDSGIEEKAGYFEDAAKVNDHSVDKIDEEALCKEFEVEAPSECVLENQKEAVAAVDESEVEKLVFDESPERTNFDQEDVNLVESDEVHVGDDDGEAKNEEGFDDWEGIERTELEKVFGGAVAFVGSKSNADKISLIDNEVKMQLYGLHKVSVEGPCFGPQPMALKVSARANWNAWKRLENLGPQDAMEQYIALLSQHVPDWMGVPASEDNNQDFSATGTSTKLHLEPETPGAVNEGKLEQMNPCIGECVSTGVDDPNIITK